MMDLQTRELAALEIKSLSREVRKVTTTGLELREFNGQLELNGLASATERAYDMGWYQETIKRGSFNKTLSEKPDVQLLMNHEGLPLARTTSGTLQLSENEQGLQVRASLNPDDPDVQRLMPKVQRGDIDQMSFAFRVVRQDWDEEYTDRQIREVDLSRGDVSVVNYGANPATSFNVRASDLVGALTEVRSGNISDNSLAILSQVLSLAPDMNSIDLRAMLLPSDQKTEEVIEQVSEESNLARNMSFDTAKAIATALGLKQRAK